MIHLDGKVERLVRNNEDMQVDAFEVTNGAKGYNAVARHIVYVGGVAADGTPKDTRTEAQRNAWQLMYATSTPAFRRCASSGTTK